MKKNLLVKLLVIEILCIITWAYAQKQDGNGNVSGPELVWSRTYGEHRVDRVTGIARHPDGGFVVAQTRFRYDPLEVHIFGVLSGAGGMIVLTKIGSGGNKAWERDYGDVNEAYHTRSIVESGDGGFLVVAGVNRTSTYLFKIDGDGRVVWEKTFTEMHHPSLLVSDGDGGFLLAGWVPELAGGLLMRISKDGEKIWGHRISGNAYASVTGTGDGEFIAIIAERSWFDVTWSPAGIFINGPQNMRILRYVVGPDSQPFPDIRQYQRLHNISIPGLQMIESDDGGVIMSSPEGVFRFDEEINMVWSRRLFPPMIVVSQPHLVGTGDGGVVAAFLCNPSWEWDLDPNPEWDLDPNPWGYLSTFGSLDLNVYRFDSEGNTLWNRTYEDPQRDLGSPPTYWDKDMGVTRSEDGGFVLAGAVLGDLRVMKIDAAGDLVWDRIHGSRDVPLDIAKAGDGGYVVAGFTQRGNMGRDGYLAMIDTEGEMVWEAWYGGPTTDVFEAVIPSGDGGFVAAGYSSSFSGDRDVYVVRIDGGGHKVWEKTYGTSEQDWAEDIVPSPGGGYLAVGNTESLERDSTYLYVLGIDEEGEKVWEKNYAHGEQDYSHGVAVSGNGYIIVGETDTWSEQDRTRELGNFNVLSGETYLLKIDDWGDIVWERTYEGDAAHSITKSSVGGFAVTTFPTLSGSVLGRVSFPRTFRMNDYGEKIWETPLLEHLKGDWEQPWGFLATDACDGGLIMAGPNLSRVDAEGELVWCIEGPSSGPSEGDRPKGGWWLFPYALQRGEGGAFLLAGLTPGPFLAFDFVFATLPGVMHIAKFRDPALAEVECRDTIPEPLIMILLLFLLIPGVLDRSKAGGVWQQEGCI